MELSNVLAIVGIVLTTVFGLWALIAELRSRRRVRITYAIDQVIALTDDITQNFQELEITYKHARVEANLVLLKSYFLNTGSRDITRDMVEEDIALALDPSFEWVDCKITDTSSSLTVERQFQSPQVISFKTGLWKSGEYLNFEALAKVPIAEATSDASSQISPARRLRRAMTITHRIADSGEIEQLVVPRRRPAVMLRGPLVALISFSVFSFLPSILIAVLGSVLLFCAHLGLFDNNAIAYVTTIDGVERTVVVSVDDDSVVLEEHGGFRRKMTVDEFGTLTKMEPRLTRQPEKIFPILGGVYILIGLYMATVTMRIQRRGRQVLRMINSKR